MNAEPTKRGPGERAGIQTQGVLAAALSAYERHGLTGLTMRSVAAELGVAPNTLYSHVKGKEGLIDAVIDALLGEVEIPDPTMEWREGLAELMQSARALLLRHAKLIPMFLSRPTRGPNAIRLGESTLQFLSRGGIRGQPAVTSLRVLLVYSIGFAAQEAPRLADPAGGKRRAKSVKAYSSARDRPHMQAMAAQMAEHPDDATFRTGLMWLIDGISKSYAGSPDGGGAP